MKWENSPKRILQREGWHLLLESLGGNTLNASKFSSVSTKQQRIAELAKQSSTMTFTSLAYHMDIEWLREAYRRTRKDGAVGVDGVTAAEYESNLEGNLQDLLERAKSGSYQAPPVRRIYIPKGKTEVRPIGVLTLEDKVLQRAVCMLLEPVFEQDFHECSYGFRPNRSAHQAIHHVWKAIMDMDGGWVLDVDVSKYFDTIEHSQLQTILRQRVNDGVITRLIGKWLNAGVLEKGQLSYPEVGSQQGGVISPLLSNIYLHHVLDSWFEDVVKPCMKGKVSLARFADDFVVIFSDQNDALRFMEVLPKRFNKFGLTIHPEKTKLIPFNKPRQDCSASSLKPGTFDFLGFTHFWGKSRKGTWAVKRKTASKKLRVKLSDFSQWCAKNMHRPLREQHKTLCAKLRGHYQYYGINGNYRSMDSFRMQVVRIWVKRLNKRSHRGKRKWQEYNDLFREHLQIPKPYIAHSDI